ncbi:MAG: hypothetical protein A2014_04745 [Spirochaetes bacterium GWF1_49_6]|jgi:flagellar protein FlgJ|nr:MAG: hypothetical protein A2014_04745 [Spirochaetes bacterium GWF1_49_6]
MDIKLGSEYLYSAQEKLSLSKATAMNQKNFSAMEDKQLKQVSDEFASLLIQEMYKAMRNTVPKDEWLNGGLKQDIFEDMLYTEYSRQSAYNGGLGLGKMIYDFLNRTEKQGV